MITVCTETLYCGSCTGRFMEACELAPKIVLLVTMLNLLYLMNECI